MSEGREYTLADMSANIRTYIPDFDLASCIMKRCSETAALQARITELEALIAAKDEALQFYAKKAGYMPGIDMPAAVYEDGGARARAALALTPSAVSLQKPEYSKIEGAMGDFETARAAGVEVE